MYDSSQLADLTRSSLHQRIADKLRAEIEDGTWPPGAKLPSASVLCGRFRVSNITVRSALRELVQAGLVESRPRSGVFVRSDRSPQLNHSSTSIGLILTAIGHPFFAEIIEAAEDACSRGGFSLTIANSGDEPEVEAEHIERLMKTSAGLLIVPATNSAPLLAYETLKQSGIPFVHLVRYVQGISAPSVVTNNRQGGYLAAHHLCEVGCRRIFLLKDYDDTAARERCEGYEQVLRERGIEPQIVERKKTEGKGRENLPEHGEAVGYDLTKQVLGSTQGQSRKAEKIGVFALNSQLARGGYLALKEAKLSIPRDVAVVGFDDFGAVYFDPPLTTIRQDLGGIGRRGAELLLDAIADNAVRSLGESSQAQQVQLEPELIIRNSTDMESIYCIRQSRHQTSMPVVLQKNEKTVLASLPS